MLLPAECDSVCDHVVEPRQHRLSGKALLDQLKKFTTQLHLFLVSSPEPSTD